jgi:hypothetical protein
MHVPFGFGFWKSPGIVGNGSMLFTAANQTYLTVPASSDWAVGTGDFTVEFWMYQTNNGNENYIFDLGISDAFSFAIASGGNTLRVRMNGSIVATLTNAVSTNTWTHIAISRSGTTLRLFQGGQTGVGSVVTNSSNIVDNLSLLYIGCKDPANPTGDHWPGNITNFRWVKGTAVYTSNFTPPTSNLTAIPNTKLLLLSQNSANLLTDSSTPPKTVTNVNGVTFSSLTPY